MCGDADLVLHSALNDLATDEYLYNKNLLDSALTRYEETEIMYVKAPLNHITESSFDFLFEAVLTYCFGFFKSSIFCCAAVLDWELKRCLVKAFPHDVDKIKKSTFGGSIAYLKEKGSMTKIANLVDEFDLINRIRNEVAVHSYKDKRLSSIFETIENVDLNRTELKKYFDVQEIKRIENSIESSKIDWLDRLALSVLKRTRELISKTCM